MTDLIQVTREDDLWIVTLNRPDKANALTVGMLEHLSQVAEDAVEAKGFILTGIGKVFSAGADLEDVKVLATHPAWERLSGAIAAIQGLTIAALNGTVAGGANGMALACDLRIAVPQAKCFYPVMKIGVLPQPSDPERMRALIGPARTKMILLAGQKITAQQAEAWGLFDQIVDPDDLILTARALCADALAADPLNLQAIKKMV